MSSASDPRPTPPQQRAAWRRPASRIRPAEALGDRLVLECARAERQGVAFSLIGVHHPIWHDSGADARAALREHVHRTVVDELRVSDAVFEAGQQGCHVVVLPHTSQSHAAVALARIERAAQAHGADDIGPAGVEAIPIHAGSADAASVLTAIAAHFHARRPPTLDEPATPQPAARLPVGDSTRLEEALHTEINLAGRDGTRLSVVALHSAAGSEPVPGLLACDVDEIAARTIRGCDQVFELGPGSVALILPRTSAADASTVAARIGRELLEHDSAAPYGTPAATVHEFDPKHPDAAAFLTALRRPAC